LCKRRKKKPQKGGGLVFFGGGGGGIVGGGGWGGFLGGWVPKNPSQGQAVIDHVGSGSQADLKKGKGNIPDEVRVVGVGGSGKVAG